MRSLTLRAVRRAAMLAALCWLTAALFAGAPAAAQPADPGQSADQLISGWDRTAAVVETALDSGSINDEALERLRNAMTEQRALARSLAERLESEAAPLRAQLSALGPKPEEGAPEAADVVAARADLEKRIATIEGRKKQAELAATRAAAMEERLAAYGRTLLADRLLQRGPAIGDWTVWLKAAEAAGSLAQAFVSGVATLSQDADPLGENATLFTALIGVLAFWIFARRGVSQVIDRLIAATRAAGHAAAQILLGLLLLALRVAPPALSALIIAQLVDAANLLPATGELFAWRLAQGVLIVALAAAGARAYFAPRAPELRVVDLGDHGAARATWLLTLLAMLVAAHRALIGPAAAAGADPAFLSVANAIIAVLAGPILFSLFQRVCRKLSSDAGEERTAASGEDGDGDAQEELDFAGGALATLRVTGSAAALVIPLAAVLGFRELSQFLLYRVSLTIAVIALGGLVYVMVQRLIGDGEEARSRAPLAPIVTVLLLTLVSAPALAFIWGASMADLRAFGARLMEGLTIGDATYSLGDVVGALLVILLGFWLTRLAQRVARRTAAPSAHLDTGAREALVTGVGYVGFFVTAMLAVSAAGLDLSSLALVAGALSVGIGFGLQNIVNNFVSGLILLIERPVKIGDWIVVGDAQGYVRKINVRSTEIETFDRASIIVPNSDLISNQVLNWTHKNLTGRCIVKVGVAYHSDPDLVMRILREEAQAHPMTLSYPKPFITFSNFGDSALEFEARVYIRDVNWVLSVHSDLNMAILKRLRAEGVEIPFPQRDLHIRSGLPQSLSAAAPVEPDPAAPARPGEINDLAKPDAEPDAADR